MKIFRCTLIPVCLFALTSCATILSKSTYPVIVQSSPTGLKYSITSKSGKVVSEGKTPSTVSLASGAGFFKAESYRIDILRGSKVVGSTKLTAGIDGWYLGNILFGGVIGFLIVDPASGAMYTLPKSVIVNSGSTLASNTSQSDNFNIALYQSLSEEERSQLISLSK